jgi:hypothetical protein
MRTETTARETGLPSESSAVAVMSMARSRLRYRIDPILSRRGATRTLAAAETTPASVTTEAEIVPLPRARRAVNVVAEPALGASVPRVGGVSDHAADTGAALP